MYNLFRQTLQQDQIFLFSQVGGFIILLVLLLQVFWSLCSVSIFSLFLLPSSAYDTFRNVEREVSSVRVCTPGSVSPVLRFQWRPGSRAGERLYFVDMTFRDVTVELKWREDVLQERTAAGVCVSPSHMKLHHELSPLSLLPAAPLWRSTTNANVLRARPGEMEGPQTPAALSVSPQPVSLLWLAAVCFCLQLTVLMILKG